MTFPRVGDLRGPLGVQLLVEIHRAGLTYEAMPSRARTPGMQRWEQRATPSRVYVTSDLPFDLLQEVGAQLFDNKPTFTRKTFIVSLLPQTR